MDNEENYFATAMTENNDIVSVWVTPDGKITDSYFLIEQADRLSGFFTTKVQDIIPNCKVQSYTELRDLQTSELSINNNIEEYLSTQPTFSYVRVFVDQEADINEETVNRLQSALSFCNGTLYIYECNDLDVVDPNNYDFSDYSYECELLK